MSAKKPAEVSGWYSKEKLTAAERAEQQRRVEEYYQRKIDLNYREMVVEAPGTMVLALGRRAQEKGIAFADFLEGILADYLEREGVDWRQQP